MIFIKILILSIIIIAIAGAGMAITILLKKNGQFPQTQVGHNKEMRKRKIYCAKVQDQIEYRNYQKKCSAKDSGNCSSCK